jgi:phosphatidate cytidylyltransferase
VLCGLGGLALVEWCRMFGGALPAGMRGWLYAVSVCYAAGLFWQTRVAGHGNLCTPEVAAMVALLLGLFALVMRHPLMGRDSLWPLLAAAIGFVYIPMAFSFGWRLLLLPRWDAAGAIPGVPFLVLVIVITKFSDMGAYIVGMLIGRRKMIPHISPGKTWAGLAGAFLGAFFGAHGMVALFPNHLAPLTHAHAVFLAAGLGSIAVVADLAESVVKRCLGVKDSGHTLPGIGGALDLIDSLLFGLPAGWLFLHWIVRA